MFAPAETWHLYNPVFSRASGWLYPTDRKDYLLPFKCTAQSLFSHATLRGAVDLRELFPPFFLYHPQVDHDPRLVQLWRARAKRLFAIYPPDIHDPFYSTDLPHELVAKDMDPVLIGECRLVVEIATPQLGQLELVLRTVSAVMVERGANREDTVAVVCRRNDVYRAYFYRTRYFVEECTSLLMLVTDRLIRDHAEDEHKALIDWPVIVSATVYHLNDGLEVPGTRAFEPACGHPNTGATRCPLFGRDVPPKLPARKKSKADHPIWFRTSCLHCGTAMVADFDKAEDSVFLPWRGWDEDSWYDGLTQRCEELVALYRSVQLPNPVQMALDVVENKQSLKAMDAWHRFLVDICAIRAPVVATHTPFLVFPNMPRLRDAPRHWKLVANALLEEKPWELVLRTHVTSSAEFAHQIDWINSKKAIPSIKIMLQTRGMLPAEIKCVYEEFAPLGLDQLDPIPEPIYAEMHRALTAWFRFNPKSPPCYRQLVIEHMLLTKKHGALYVKVSGEGKHHCHIKGIGTPHRNASIFFLTRRLANGIVELVQFCTQKGGCNAHPEFSFPELQIKAPSPLPVDVKSKPAPLRKKSTSIAQPPRRGHHIGFFDSTDVLSVLNPRFHKNEKTALRNATWRKLYPKLSLWNDHVELPKYDRTDCPRTESPTTVQDELSQPATVAKPATMMTFSSASLFRNPSSMVLTVTHKKRKAEPPPPPEPPWTFRYATFRFKVLVARTEPL